MEIRGQRILVTGAAGFIGSHLSERLAGDNELILVDDLSVGTRQNLAALEKRPGARFVAADVTDRDAVLRLMEGIDIVFHLAISCLRTSLNRPVLSHDINAGGTLSVCLAAREASVQRLLYVSSSEVYGSAQSVPMSENHPCRPTTVYGASKLAGELYALSFWHSYGLPVSVVRPFNTYGPREPYEGARAEVIPRFLLRLAAGEAPVIYGDGAQTRDFTYVGDTVSGLVQAAACDALVGDVVNIAYGQEVSIRHIAQRLAEATGTDIATIHAEPRPGDVKRHFADIGKAQRLFGFAPRTDLERGLTHTLEWFRAQGIDRRGDSVAAGAPNW